MEVVLFGIFRQAPFAWMMGLSVAIHLGIFLLCRGDFEPPSDVPPREGKSSIRLRASVAASPRPSADIQRETRAPTLHSPVEQLPLFVQENGTLPTPIKPKPAPLKPPEPEPAQPVKETE